MSAIEKNATIQCQSQSPIAGFYLQKDEDQMDHKHMETNGTRGSYTISNISRADGGGYRCRYSSESEPFVISEPSDPVELLLEGKESLSLSPSHHMDPFQKKFLMSAECLVAKH